MFPKTDKPGPPPVLPFRSPLTGEVEELPRWIAGWTDEEADSDSPKAMDLGSSSSPASSSSKDAVGGSIKRSIHASGGDSGGMGVADTLDIPVHRGLRIMSWNLQDLGGGPSRSPRRSDEVIRRIAWIILECDPDICVIMEVKQRIWLPPKPVKPTLPRATRSQKDQAVLDQELRRRQEKYEVKLQEWRERSAHVQAEAADPRQAPGILELNRIVDALRELAPNRYLRILPETIPGKQVFTEGETYGFLYKVESVAPVVFELITKDSLGEPLLWPEAGFRAPGRALFRAVNWPNLVDVVAFHAPAPSHGAITHRAIEQFANLGWGYDTVVAGDFNVDTEAGSEKVSDTALDTLLSFYDGDTEDWLGVHGNAEAHFEFCDWNDVFLLTGLFTGKFWQEETGLTRFDGFFEGFASRQNGQQTVLRLDRQRARLDFDDLMVRLIDEPANEQALETSHQEGMNKSAANDAPVWNWLDDSFGGKYSPSEREIYSIAAEGSETSLRKKVELVDEDPFDPAICGFCDTEVFNSAGYDKMFVVPHAGFDPRKTIEPVAGWIYPLFERCLPEAHRGMFEETSLTRGAIHEYWLARSGAQQQDGNRVGSHLAALEKYRKDLRAKQRKGRAQRDERPDASSAITVKSFDFPEEDSRADSSYEEGDSDLEAAPPVVKLPRIHGPSVVAVKQALQGILKDANEISDHVPLILDVKLWK